MFLCTPRHSLIQHECLLLKAESSGCTWAQATTVDELANTRCTKGFAASSNLFCCRIVIVICVLVVGALHLGHLVVKSMRILICPTVGAICLGPTGNLQGSHKFLSLVAGKKITHHSFAHLWMPKEVVDCVNELGEAEQQPQLLTFCDCHGHPIRDIANLSALATGVDEDDDDKNAEPDDGAALGCAPVPGNPVVCQGMTFWPCRLATQ